MKKELNILKNWIRETDNIEILNPIKDIISPLIIDKMVDTKKTTMKYAEYLVKIGTTINEEEQYSVACWSDCFIIDIIDRAVDLELYEVAENLKKFSEDYFKNYY
jgi:hypothetical protein